MRWRRWGDKRAQKPAFGIECIGLWIHKSRRSFVGYHCEPFVYQLDHNGFPEVEGVCLSNLRSYRKPDLALIILLVIAEKPIAIQELA